MALRARAYANPPAGLTEDELDEITRSATATPQVDLTGTALALDPSVNPQDVDALAAVTGQPNPTTPIPPPTTEPEDNDAEVGGGLFSQPNPVANPNAIRRPASALGAHFIPSGEFADQPRLPRNMNTPVRGVFSRFNDTTPSHSARDLSVPTPSSTPINPINLQDDTVDEMQASPSPARPPAPQTIPSNQESTPTPAQVVEATGGTANPTQAPSAAEANPAPTANDDDQPVGSIETMPAVPRRGNLPSRSSYSLGETPEEMAAVAKGHRQDTRRHKGGRVAHGIGMALGTLGILTGRAGLFGLGAAGVSAGRELKGSHREQDAQELANQRIAGEQQRFNQDTAAVNEQYAQDRQAYQDQVAARRLASEEQLAHERVLSAQADRANADFEQAALTGNAAGMRGAIRARIAQIDPHNNQGWDNWANGENSSLDSITDIDALRSILNTVNSTDPHRGSSGGGGSRSHTFLDANGNLRTVRTGGSGGGGGSTPGTGRRAAPGAAPATPSGEAPPINEIDLNDPAELRTWMSRTLHRAGLDDQDTLAGYLLSYEQAPTDAARSAILTEVRGLATQAEQAEAGGRPAGVSEQDWRRMNSQLTPLAITRGNVLNLASRVQYWIRTSPVALRAAMALTGRGDTSEFDATTLTQAQEIIGEISGVANRLLKERSGQAVTDNELRRALTELGAGRWTTPPSTFLALINRQVDRYEDEIEEYSRDYPQAAVDAWAANHLGSR